MIAATSIGVSSSGRFRRWKDDRACFSSKSPTACQVYTRTNHLTTGICTRHGQLPRANYRYRALIMHPWLPVNGHKWAEDRPEYPMAADSPCIFHFASHWNREVHKLSVERFVKLERSSQDRLARLEEGLFLEALRAFYSVHLVLAFWFLETEYVLPLWEYCRKRNSRGFVSQITKDSSSTY